MCKIPIHSEFVKDGQFDNADVGNCHKEEIDENKKEVENKDGNGINI